MNPTHSKRFDEVGVSGIREILQMLSTEDLVSLAKTVTIQVVDAKSGEDAMNTVILHSPDLQSILRRKVIKRHLLFQYLHNKGVSVLATAVKEELINTIIELWTKNDSVEVGPDEIKSTKDPTNPPSVQTMAEEFVKWFYPVLSSRNMHIDNFWKNSEMLIIRQWRNGTCQNFTFNTGIDIVNGLLQLINTYSVTLYPNLNGGVSAEMDNHGLVMVNCSGTLYNGNTCNGVFEQTFALTPDPGYNGDWKIKKMKLHLKQVTADMAIESNKVGNSISYY